MPIFIDRHALTAIPAAVRHQIHLEAMHRLRDVSGAQPLGHWANDGYIYCVIVAPSEEALCEHHKSRGLPCDEVHVLGGLRGSHPLTGDEINVVRTAITTIWHANQ